MAAPAGARRGESRLDDPAVAVRQRTRRCQPEIAPDPGTFARALDDLCRGLEVEVAVRQGLRLGETAEGLVVLVDRGRAKPTRFARRSERKHALIRPLERHHLDVLHLDGRDRRLDVCL